MTAEPTPQTRPQCVASISIARYGVVYCQRQTGHHGAHKALTAIHRNGAEETLKWHA